jgi:DNA-directed RNA polymerase specialized sigma24 family protein
VHREEISPLNGLGVGKRRSADAVLVQQMRQGDAAAGRHFVREHYPSIYRYLRRLTGNPETAEDLTQETFLQAWRRLETYDDRGALSPWLQRIAYREFLQSLLAVARKSDPRIPEEQFMPQEAHLVPTELSLVFLYSTGVLHECPVRAVRPFSTDGFLTTGPE